MVTRSAHAGSGLFKLVRQMNGLLQGNALSGPQMAQLCDGLDPLAPPMKIGWREVPPLDGLFASV